ncbi:MAG: hypothetical protein HQK55_15000, partial [Deltaproteobacteria bacterium]|nr:hypothetical protein [Deltaproteobacteria bacterium]
TDVENRWLDEEKLTMFAAPRSSAGGTHRALVKLNRLYGAAAYWIYVDHDQVYCFNKVDEGCPVETGFKAGQVLPLSQTNISSALSGPGAVWIEEENVCSLLIPITSGRGHPMGCVGLTVPGATADAPEISEIFNVLGLDAHGKGNHF